MSAQLTLFQKTGNRVKHFYKTLVETAEKFYCHDKVWALYSTWMCCFPTRPVPPGPQPGVSAEADLH